MRRARLPVHEAVDCGVQIARGLAAAHERGIVHRDLKPENVFLARRADAIVPKLLDFGIAKLSRGLAGERPLTLQGIVLGTPAFVAPVRVLGAPYDGRSDVYGVGAMLYRMLTGQLPFAEAGTEAHAILAAKITSDPRPPRAVDPAIPAAAEAVVMRAMRRDPSQRPSAGELADDLERLR